MTSSISTVSRTVSIAVFCLAFGFGFSSKTSARVTEIQALQAGPNSTTSNGVEGSYRLINLNPNLGIWYLLVRDYLGESQYSHLEVPRGVEVKLQLDRQSLVVDGTKGQSRCNLEGENNPIFAKSTQTFTASCSSDLIVRHSTSGSISSGEIFTHFAERWNWSDRLYYHLKTRYLNRPDEFNLAGQSPAANPDKPDFTTAILSPSSARMKPETSTIPLPLDQIGIRLARSNPLMNGGWLEVQNPAGKTIPGVTLSMVTPQAVNAPLKIPEGEKSNLVYLLGFDLSQLRFNYHIGGSQPDFGWSRSEKNPQTSPGPDGFKSISPLTRNGIVPFWQVRNLVAVLSGGMDRHGNSASAAAFDEVSPTSGGSRLYGGMIQSGVTLSRLNPGFATFYGFADGRVGIKAWQDSDRATIAPNLQFARQNGFMIVENGGVAPMVYKRSGNWNGNDLWPQTQVRSGICIQKTNGRDYLIYGLFSGATPITMARVFIAYGCDQAMQLEIGSYATSFAEVFAWDTDGGTAQSLSSRTEKYSRKKRFIAESDHRDFFTVSLK
ncbi:MAG: hypothetical protein QM523_09205 [Candidatus Pacebacteria bacterium]|nr:hypothetical protein [Candidatus Paceibacterota bacterium]